MESAPAPPRTGCIRVYHHGERERQAGHPVPLGRGKLALGKVGVSPEVDVINNGRRRVREQSRGLSPGGRSCRRRRRAVGDALVAIPVPITMPIGCWLLLIVW